MALEGTFKDFHIADIVQLIGLQRKTGTLTLEGEEDTLSVVFQDGAVVWAQSTRVPWEQRMARLLVLRGLLTPTQLHAAVSLQRETGKSLRVVLAGEGFLQEKDWERVLTLEVEAAVCRPFRWKAGRYRFVTQESVDLANGKIGPLDAERLLMEGIRQVDEWPRIQEKVPSSGTIFRLDPLAGTLTAKQGEFGEAAMLGLVDGRRTVQELVDASGVGEFRAWRSLALLVEAGVIVPAASALSTAPGVTPSPLAAPTRSARRRLAPPEWLPRVAWGVAIVWLLLCVVFFGMDPLGLAPMSATGTASLDRVRGVRALADLGNLAHELERHATEVGAYPERLEVLAERDRALGRQLQDPWGHPYQIRRTGAEVSVLSAGPDGRAGTPDDLAVSVQ